MVVGTRAFYSWLGLLNGVYLLGLPFFDPNSWGRHAWSDGFWLLAGLNAFVTLAYLSYRSTRARAGWAYMAIATGTWTLGIALWSWEELFVGRISPSPGLADIGPIGFGVFSWLAVARLYRTPHRFRFDLARVLEILISVGVLGLTVGALLYVPLTSRGPFARELWAPYFNSLSFSGALVTGIYWLSLGRPRLSWKAACLLLGGLAANLGAHFAYVYAHLWASYQSGRFVDALWVLAFSALAAGAWEERRVQAEGKSEASLEVARERGPFVAASLWAFFLACLFFGLWSYRFLIPAPYLVLLTVGFVLAVLVVAYLELGWIRERDARRELQHALAMRDDFMSISAHELKGPLTTLNLNVRLLEHFEERVGDEAVEERRRALRQSRRQLDQIVRLVEDMSDGRRYVSQAMPIERSRGDVVRIVRETLERFRQSIDRQNVDVLLKAPERAFAEIDEHCFERAVRHMVSNAVKHGSGLPIHVNLEVTKDRVRVTVQDEGVGVASSLRRTFFERLVRTSAHRHYPGFGLAHFVVRKIAEAHGGEWRVDEHEGPGARSVFELPRWAPEVSEDAKRAPQNPLPV